MKAHIPAVRVTMNNARTGDGGRPLLADHNSEEQGKAAKMGGLLYKWNYLGDKEKSFDNVEAVFYDETFSEGLAVQNAEHKKCRHYKRVKNMDEYRKSKATCPESTMFCLGDKYGHAPADTLRRAVEEFLAWRAKAFPQVFSLDWALHIEEGAPHIHERHAWIGHDEYGNKIADQGRALEEMGVLPPDPDKAREAAEYRAKAKEASTKEERKKLISKAKGIERYNNAKMTYTAECREKLQEIARSYGLEIIIEPREKGKQGRSQARYITDDNAEKLARQSAELVNGEKALLSQRQDSAMLDKEIAAKRAELEELKELKQEIDDTLEVKGLLGKRAAERAARKAEKAREEREELARNFWQQLETDEETNDEIIDMGMFEDEEEEQEAKNVREIIQNALETLKMIYLIPDTPKSITPLKMHAIGLVGRALETALKTPERSEAYRDFKKACNALEETDTGKPSEHGGLGL